MTQQSKKNIITPIITTILTLLVVLIGFLVSLPSIISTDWGNAQLIKIINTNTPGTVKAGKIDLSLWGTQHISDFTYDDEQGGTHLAFKYLTSNASLYDLIFHGIHSGNVELTGLYGTITKHQDTQPIIINVNDVNAMLTRGKGPELFKLHATGSTKQNKLVGQFQIDSEFSEEDIQKLLTAGDDPEELLDLKNTDSVHIKINATNFPVTLLDQFFAHAKTPNIFTLVLGETLNITLDETPTPQGISFQLNANSMNLQANIAGGIEARKLFLTRPGTFILKVEPQTLDILSSLGYHLTAPTEAKLTIDKWSLPLKFKSKKAYDLDLTDLVFLGRLELQQVALKGDTQLGDTTFSYLTTHIVSQEQSQDIAIEINGEAIQNGQPIELKLKTALDKSLKFNRRHLPDVQMDFTRVPTVFVDQFLGAKHALVEALGEHMNLKIQAEPRKHETEVTIRMESERLTIPNMRLILNENLTVPEPIHLNYKLGSDLANRFLSSDSPIQLHNDLILKMKLHIDPIENFLNIAAMSDLKVTGHLEVDELALTVNNRPNSAAVQNIDIPWEVNGYDNVIKVEFLGSSQVLNQQARGTIQGFLVVKDFLIDDNKPAKIDAKLNFAAFPVAILDAFTKNNHLVGLLGNTVDIDLNANLVNGKFLTGIAEIKLAGYQLNTDLALNIGPIITLERESTIAMTLTAPRFDTLRSMLKGPNAKSDKLNLVEDANINLKITSLQYPISKTEQKIQADATLFIDKIVVVDPKDNQQLFFEQVNARVQTQDIAKSFSFDLRAKQTESDLNFTGHADNAFDSEGHFDFNTLSLNLNSKMIDLPASFLCRVVCVSPEFREKVEALFGKKIDADIKVTLKQKTGPIKASLKGANGSVDFDGQLTNGVLTLNKSFESEFILTPELGHNILEEVFPLLSGIIKADQPLHISVDSNGFSIPVTPFEKSRVQVGQITLTLGKVLFRTDGQLGTVLSLLNPTKADKIMVWFTPLYLNVQNGVLGIHRLDMLVANSYPIATWGKVDFVKDRVNLIIGLTGQAISKAFNVKVDNGYMLQLPLKGTTSNSNIDKRKAATKIGAFVAQSQGTPHGMVIGTVLNIAGGGLTEPKPPAPTTSPLPWANGDTGSTLEDDAQIQPGQPVNEAPPQVQQEQQAPNIVESLIQQATQSPKDQDGGKKHKHKKKHNSDIIQEQAGNLLQNFLK